MRVVAGHSGGHGLRPRSIVRLLGALAGLLAVTACGPGSPGPAATTLAFTGDQPESNVPKCVERGFMDATGRLKVVPDDFYRLSVQASPTTLSGDVICANEITAPLEYRAWVFLYWVRQADGPFVPVSATIRIKTTIPAPPGGRPILSWAHGTRATITDNCAPSHDLPAASYGPPVADFLDEGFAVVATDYIGLGTPGVHPYLAAKSEGTAVVAVARAAQKFSPAQASGPVLIAGLSQGGYAALWADYVAQAAEIYAPGLEVSGVIALSPPTDLLRIALFTISNPNPDSITNLIIAAGSWHRRYNDLPYPGILTSAGQDAAQAVSDPDVLPSSGRCIPLPVSGPFQPGELPAAWTDRLRENSVPTDSLSRTTPLLVVQGTDDQQVPYPVTLTAVRQMCASGVPVTFDVIEGGDHGAPVRVRSVRSLILPWAQGRLGGNAVENSCASLPPPAQLTMYTVVWGDNLSDIAQRFHVAGGWQALYQLNNDIIGSNPDLIQPGWHLFIS
jgi:pimeloyl-ACP methyl ester carboxylesterase